jgi:hypothetical protein
MYCPQCGTQTEQQTKFCKACGLKLTDHARLLEEPREAERMSEAQVRREKQLMIGVILTIVSLSDLLLFFIIFAATTLPFVSRSQLLPGLLMLVSFLAGALIPGGIGVAKLVRSGFFKNLRERQLRYELALIEQKRKALEASAESAAPDINVLPRPAEAISITERTTRELQGAPVTTRKIKGE